MGDAEPGTGLPASIEVAWGLRDRAAKGPKPALSLARIIDAAIQVAESEGLAAVSMSRIAQELGASTMSLYRYVSAKNELLDLMTDTVMGSPPARPDRDEGWREGLSRWCWSLLTAMRRHPWVARVPISGPPITPNNIAWIEDGLRSMRGTGLQPGEKMSIILMLSTLVRADVNLTAQLLEAQQAAGVSMDETMVNYHRALTKILDPQRFPELTKVVTSGVLAQADSEDDEFAFGFERVLDGIDSLIRTRAR